MCAILFPWKNPFNTNFLRQIFKNRDTITIRFLVFNRIISKLISETNTLNKHYSNRILIYKHHSKIWIYIITCYFYNARAQTCKQFHWTLTWNYQLRPTTLLCGTTTARARPCPCLLPSFDRKSTMHEITNLLSVLSYVHFYLA